MVLIASTGWILWMVLSAMQDAGKPAYIDLKPFVGVWQAYQDDDTPGQKPPENDKFYIYPDGTLIFLNLGPEGKASLKCTKTEFYIKLGTNQYPPRPYVLEKDVLKFQNAKTGYIYYRRIAAEPPAK